MSEPQKIHFESPCDMTGVEVMKTTRRKRSNYDVWLLQGTDLENGREFYIHESELDRWIEALHNVKQVIAKDKEEN